MYGTVMVGALKGSRGDVEQALADWQSQQAPGAAGFVDSGILVSDDGSTVAMFARFESKETYVALSDDPEQDRWYQSRLAPLLEGEPRWIDGEWAALPSTQSASGSGTA